ncbi:MAG: hypothetical protein JOY79_03640, partial [Acidobacteriaceae bacterium]|nr:hypothetical protein [Acidobacteriaceae bacterium]
MREDDRRLDYCLNCTDCNAACPVMKVLPNFPGPKALGPALERVRKEGIACETPWLEYCLGCHGCSMACPNQVNVSELLANAKLQQPKHGRVAIRDRFFARPDLLGKICSTAPALSHLLLSSPPNRWLMSKVLRIGAKRPFPRYHSPAVSLKANGASRKTIFFPGCFLRYNDPLLMQIIVDTLQSYGSVEIAQTACCGVPALANGDRSQLFKDLRVNVHALSSNVQQGASIVTACSSCGHMLKAEYPRLLQDDPQLSELAHSISEHTYDLAEFLLEVGDQRPAKAHEVSLRLAYHAPCHLKAQGIGRPWLQILRAIPGIAVQEIATECC